MYHKAVKALQNSAVKYGFHDGYLWLTNGAFAVRTAKIDPESAGAFCAGLGFEDVIELSGFSSHFNAAQIVAISQNPLHTHDWAFFCGMNRTIAVDRKLLAICERDRNVAYWRNATEHMLIGYDASSEPVRILLALRLTEQNKISVRDAVKALTI